MPFFLDGNPTPGELSEAVNYLLSNLQQGQAADVSNGQITGPTGVVSGYLYKYLFVKYADSYDGSVGFSDTPTNKAFYGLSNNSSSTESTNPADYVWFAVTGGFGTTKFLYYITTGGRQIQFNVSITVPDVGWVKDDGTAIDLDVITGVSGPANFVVIRITNDSNPPTDAECISAIGRTPVAGDMCTINYNSGISSIVYKYTTGWAVFQKYITGDLIVANSVTATNIAANTITAAQIASNTITASQIASNTITASQIAANTITASQIAANTITASQIASNTITASQIAANTITASQIASNTITADRLNVIQLSAISANMGTITAGTIRLPGSGTSYIIIDGANNRIDVYDSGVLRVRIGNLA